MLANLVATAILLAGVHVLAEDPADTVHFHLFTRSSANDYQLDSELGGFDASKPTMLIIHGFGGSAKAKSALTIKDALLRGRDWNAVLADWGALAKSEAGYEVAVKNTVAAGKAVARFVKKLLRLPGSDRGNLTVVGFSLGAHVAGIVSDHMSPDKLNTIIALDAAGPMYGNKTLRPSLDAGDALFVMAVHTSADVLGVGYAVGHVDFFPNGGRSPQPPCEYDEVKQVCSHYMAVLLFAESLYNPEAFSATRCSSWSDYTDMKCKDQQKIFMGLETPKTARGEFFLKTNAVPPYGNRSTGEYLKLTPQDLMDEDTLLDEVYNADDNLVTNSTVEVLKDKSQGSSVSSGLFLVWSASIVVVCR